MLLALFQLMMAHRQLQGQLFPVFLQQLAPEFNDPAFWPSEYTLEKVERLLKLANEFPNLEDGIKEEIIKILLPDYAIKDRYKPVGYYVTNEEVALVQQGKKIMAIKRFRDRHPTGLRAAKAVMDQIEKGNLNLDIHQVISNNNF